MSVSAPSVPTDSSLSVPEFAEPPDPEPDDMATCPPFARRLTELPARYCSGMKTLTKSSITVRRGLRLLRDTTDRAALREGYRAASLATRDSLAEELRDLDALTAEGLDRL